MPRLTEPRRRDRMPRAHTLGALSAITGLVLMTLPLTANAAEAERVLITTRISDDVASAPLGGTTVSVHPADDPEQVIATGVTGADGTVSLDVPATDTSFIAEASWRGAIGDLVDSAARTEFNPALGDPVSVVLGGSFGAIGGSVTATTDAGPVSDLSGSTITILSGGTAVQRIAVAADGTFTSGALPTTSTDDYSISFEPATGFTLTDAQPSTNPAFALPRGVESPSTIDVTRSFALTADSATPTPTPTPDPSPSTPTPTPTPTPDPSPSTPTPTPDVPSIGPIQQPYVTFFQRPDDTGLTDVFSDISESELAALLATAAGTPNSAVPLLNASGQALGLAQQPTADKAAAASQLLAPVVADVPGLTVNQISLTAFDLEGALLAVQSGRAQLLDQQLSSQLTDVQKRNARVATLNKAISALRAYVAAPTDGSLAVAVTTAGAAVESHDLLSATSDSPEARTAAASLVASLRIELDSVTNTQQTDMLRLASLSNKRNDAFDMMTDVFQKMLDSRSAIIGSMRSTPVSIGTVQWDSGAITGRFDLAAVEGGEHHLIISFDDIGLTVVAAVTVERRELAATGFESSPAPWVGAALLVLGGAALIGSSVRARRHEHV